jgi:mono/diheme cytochrome c family protein
VIGRYPFTKLLLLSVIGCSKPDGDIRSWRPGDHDQEAETTTSLQPAVPVRQEAIAEKKPDNALATWSSLCAGCHGQLAEGNGPMGAAMGARNLSDPRWQSAVTDDQIATSILRGKGRMPAFSLPPEIIKDLVHLIRGRQTSDKDGGVGN